MKNPTTSPSSPRKSLALCRAVGIALLVVSAATPWAARSSTVPLDFPVELSRPARLEFNAYYGEAIDITATLNYQGSAFEGSLTDPQLYYQTPTMGTSFWSLPATQTNNLLKVVFPASAQPGPGRLNCFLGSAGENYRAAFVLNLRASPGASPNSLPLPTPTLDFSQVTILNSPYETSADATTAHTNLAAEISAVAGSVATVSNALETAQADLSRQIAAATPADYADVKSQVATNTSTLASHSSQLSQLSQGVAAALTTESDPTVPAWAKSSTKPTYTLNEVAPNSENWLGVQGNAGRLIKILAQGSGSSPAGGVQVTASTLNNNNTTTYAYSGVAVKRNGTNTDYLWDTSSQSGIVRRSELGDYATTNQLDASDRLIIDLISSTNVLLTVTNVASQVEIPSASIQYATTNGLETVWNELDRHTATLNAAKNYADTSISNSAAYLTSQINSKANKSWSQYTSGLGADAPTGVTWISTPETVIAGGYEYAKTITSGGNVWVLTSNGLQLGQGGSVTNFFQIASADGSPIFRIDKTDAQLVEVDADDIEVVDTTVLVSIALATNTHPYARVSTNLVYNATAWYKEDENGMPAGSPATVSWSGTSGAWVCTADFGQSDNGYLYFEFLQPGETKIVNCGLTDLSGGVIFEGVKYYPVAENGELKFKVRNQ